jgi:hypothetical protein
MKYKEPTILSEKERQNFIIKEIVELAFNDIGFADRINKMIFPFTSIWKEY